MLRHKQVLQLLEKGLLTRGVLHGVAVGAVEGSGWQLAYSAPYAHRTRDSDLESIPQSARYVMVAAIHVGESSSGDSSGASKHCLHRLARARGGRRRARAFATEGSTSERYSLLFSCNDRCSQS